ncbi:hypothetical protein ANO11243_070230 [Dothideomycetidae sp. 11243]|nr:hypothetical protein ANO11243_070230 [fungal sp. No.11243]
MPPQQAELERSNTIANDWEVLSPYSSPDLPRPREEAVEEPPYGESGLLELYFEAGTDARTNTADSSEELTPKVSEFPSLNAPIPYPSFSGQRLSSAMQDMYGTGRFWFVEMLHDRFVGSGEKNRPWRELTERYLRLLDNYKTDEAGVDRFDNMKMKDRGEYNHDLEAIKREIDDAKKLALVRESLRRSKKKMENRSRAAASLERIQE